jgi:RHS repeat-associated protein
MNRNATRYVWDQAADLPQLLSDGTTLYVPGVGQWNGTSWVYELTDGLGSVRQLSDASGNVVQSYTYAPFGELLAAQGTRSSALQYTGEQKDVDTGLVYLRARWYDSATGRFTSRDPFPGFAALPQTLHPYVYVNNNPVNLTDPSGKFAFLPLLVVAILGGIIGGVSYYTIQAIINADPCLGVQWHWQEALFWGGAGGVIGGLIGAAAYGGWQLGAKAIAWLRAISLGGGGASTCAANGECAEAIQTGINAVYRYVENGVTKYIGITNDLARRASEHLRQSGFRIEPIQGLQNLSRFDARAVEQVLIEHYGLPNLLNKINSISPDNPIYPEAIQRGYEILKTIGFFP